MDRVTHLLRSELFLSLAGGFALGVIGVAFITPANANEKAADAAQSISIGGPLYDTAPQTP